MVIEQEEMDDMENVDTESAELAMTDSMAQAGRKILAQQFEKFQAQEAGSRTGEDIEAIHDMRVASRRMRSVLRLLSAYYKAKYVKQFLDGLQSSAGALGRVRDLDVLLTDLQAFQAKQADDEKQAMQGIIDRFQKRRVKALANLNHQFDSSEYAKFIKNFGEFVSSESKGALPVDIDENPYQVRHILPVLLHKRLSTVRAYETIIETVDDETLHNLRIEFKRLRYALEFFEPLLGSSAGGFISAIKEMQDFLGRMNDMTVFEERVKSLKKLSSSEKSARDAYIASLQLESATAHEQVVEKWMAFNKRNTQRLFSDALLVLR